MATFDNSFQTLPGFLFERVTPTPLKNPKLIHTTHLVQELNLGLSDQELMAWLNGESDLPGDQRIATRYAGHQFGVWAGQLGDGRAISLGEVITSSGERKEIQTKGSGLTPFSRMGDGKAVIRSSVREYLCSEAMAALNIPTTRVLALMTGEDNVYRETIEKSALVARVFPSNIRFGHFELLYHFKKPTELKALIDYIQRLFYPGLSLEEMLEEIVHRTAKLVAHWMGVGFCHGVMNTDNMSVLGLTIDYGPYGFLEDTKLDYICNHSDHQGRYAYFRQPEVAHWNLSRLLTCFADQLSTDALQTILNTFPVYFKTHMEKIARAKLGLEVQDEGDLALYMKLLQRMHDRLLDFTSTFRRLSRGDLHEELGDWSAAYLERLKRESVPESERFAKMLKINPKYVLRNYIAQLVIDDVEAGSTKVLEDWLKILYRPFDEHPAFKEFSLPTPYDRKNLVVSCSS